MSSSATSQARIAPSTNFPSPLGSELYNYTTSNGVRISPSTTVKDLEVITSSDLSWHRHISTMVGSATKMSALALSLFQDRSKVTMFTLYRYMVRCRLESGCPLWNPADIASIQAIEPVQQHFTKRISGFQHLHFYDRLKISPTPAPTMTA